MRTDQYTPHPKIFFLFWDKGMKWCLRIKFNYLELHQYQTHEYWVECRLFSSTFAKILLQKFGNIANSNVELIVDCLAQHSQIFCFRTYAVLRHRMLCRKSIDELNTRQISALKIQKHCANECWAVCRLSSSTFAKIQLQKFGNFTNSNVELNVHCLAQH